MAQEWDEDEENYRQEMEKVIDLLKEYNIDFEVSDTRIMIPGEVRHADLHSLPTIGIVQGDNEIGFEESLGWNRVVVSRYNHVGDVILSKNVYADYYYPYLIIHF